MASLVLLVGFLIAVFNGCHSLQQLQMPEAGALLLPDEELLPKLQMLEKNMTDVWTYIYQLRAATMQHLNHLREHQVELEKSVDRLQHFHEGQEDTHASHTDDHHGDSHDSHHHGDDHHHHSGEQHSHSEEHHSHGDDSHGDHHSHGDDSHGDHHNHGDQHSHGDSHSAEHHGQDHYHESHSHSHSESSPSGSHSHHHEEDDEHHHDHHSHDHKDSHEKQDDLQQSVQSEDLQQTQKETGPMVEPLVVPTQARSHSHADHTNHHHHHHSHQQLTNSSFMPMPMAHHHHHHHDPSVPKNQSRTVVVIPKFSEADLYHFAVCNVAPNTAIPAESQQEIVGQVSMWQKKMGGPLNIHVRVKGFKMDNHHHHHGAHQDIQQEQDNETPTPQNHRHGFHIHASGDMSNGCQSMGPHFNPKNVNHGGPTALVRHVGDLGNIECDEHGATNIVFTDEIASLKGQYSIIGKGIVIHSDADDFGLGANEESLRTGNAGTRIACCVIEKVTLLPIRSFKAIKTAAQFKNY